MTERLEMLTEPDDELSEPKQNNSLNCPKLPLN